MNRVIRSYSKFPVELQSAIYSSYSFGKLERTILPYQGAMTDGIIFNSEDAIYLIPISTIFASVAKPEKKEVELDLLEDDDLEDDDLEDSVEDEEMEEMELSTEDFADEE